MKIFLIALDDWVRVQSKERLRALKQYPVRSLIGPGDLTNDEEMLGK